GEGVTGRLPLRRPHEMETNFTNLKEGSFISVRYRMAGNVAEVINLNLIEYPVLTPEEAAEVPGGVPAAVPGAQVGPGAGRPAVPPERAPARVPVVPGQTVSPGLLPK
ncbi:MAG TPA: hypothetical protein VFT74_16190, partial [Isosphaeraceae bacterium]|nr:hypothetical protein [Isosphaeraceae bacterium]